MKPVSDFVPVRFRTGFNDDGVAAGDAAALECRDVSLTVQEGRDEADLNKIMARYVVSGVVPQVTRVPLEGDFTEIVDYRTAVEAIRRADEAFMSLDPALRARFGQDPARFHDFCLDPANLPELRRLGLAVPAPAAAEAPPAAAPASPPPA